MVNWHVMDIDFWASSYEQLNEPGRGAGGMVTLWHRLQVERMNGSLLACKVCGMCRKREESLDFVRSVVQQIGSGKLSVNDQREADLFGPCHDGGENNHKANALSSARKVLSFKRPWRLCNR